MDKERKWVTWITNLNDARGALEKGLERGDPVFLTHGNGIGQYGAFFHKREYSGGMIISIVMDSFDGKKDGTVRTRYFLTEEGIDNEYRSWSKGNHIEDLKMLKKITYQSSKMDE